MRGLRWLLVLGICGVVESAVARAPHPAVPGVGFFRTDAPEHPTEGNPQADRRNADTDLRKQRDAYLSRDDRHEGDSIRVERRAERARLYAASIDSVIGSGRYTFVPNSMQELPGGMIRSIYAYFYFFSLDAGHVAVHLPTERPVTNYMDFLNFDSPYVANYKTAHMPWGWLVTFEVTVGEVVYAVNMQVSTITGETMLTMLTPDLTMRYVGWLWFKERHRDTRE